MKDKTKIEKLEAEKQRRKNKQMFESNLWAKHNVIESEESVHLRTVSSLEELEFNSNVSLLMTKLKGWMSSLKKGDKRHNTYTAMFLAASSMMVYQMNQKNVLIRAEREYRKKRKMHLTAVSRIAELEKQIKSLEKENEFLSENNN
jgi:hypothetical protein